jgi:tetratricopeptide (TPR) repeat protein
MSFRFPPSAILLLLGAVLALTWWAYVPGLHGGFLFDDFGNLPAIGASGPVDTWPTFWRYITSGTADPTGRPLTLLTFLLDARNWPADPYPFKLTNLILHLLNGVLLAALLRWLGLDTFEQASQRRIEMAAVLGAALWLLHPLLVSTTLYIVQREAMLPATFTLLGLLLWLQGRHDLRRGRTIQGITWIALGLGGCTVLGVLSKANGILLPALALVIEYVLLRASTAKPFSAPVGAHPVRDAFCIHHDQNSRAQGALLREPGRGAGSRASALLRGARTYAWAMAIFGWLPAALVAGYLLDSAWNGFVHGVSAVRPWTMGQRLLTEPRVLMDYLDLLWLPRPFTPGLFNDQIKASLSLWSPATTLPALLAVLGLIVGAWSLRRRWPAFALAILFYFVGQSLESSTIPLELYYEHRNYLPAMLMFWPLALWLCGVSRPKASRASALLQEPGLPSMGAHPVRDGLDTAEQHRAQGALLRGGVIHTDWAKGALAAVLLLGLALMTHARAQLWGNTHEQGELWATLNPDSPRAQANAALLEMAAGQPRPAITRLETLLRAQPDQVQLAFNLIGAHCMLGALGPHDLAQARYAISNTRDPGSLLTHWFDGSIPVAVAGECRGLDLDALDRLLDAGLANARLIEVDGRRQDLLYLKGRIALARHDPATTLRDFNAALDQDVRPGAALEQAALLGSAGYPRHGLAHLQHYEAVRKRQIRPGFGMPWLHAWVLRQQDYWPREIAHLRDTLQHDAEAKVANPR